MELNSLIGLSYALRAFGSKNIHKWEVTKANKETKYVYTERDSDEGKVGQWLPAEFVSEIVSVESLRKKIDAIRKSRDYFKSERDELNDRISKISQGNQQNDRIMIEELAFLKEEMLILEKDLSFWKSFALYSTGFAFVLFFSIFAVRWIFC